MKAGIGGGLTCCRGSRGCGKCAARTKRHFREMMRLDVAYIRRRSIWLDVSILLADDPGARVGLRKDSIAG